MSNKLHISFFCDGMGGGGAEHQLLALVKNINSSLILSLFSIQGGSLAESIGKSIDDLIISKNSQKGLILSLFKEIFTFLNKRRPNVVCSWGGWKAALLAGITCRFLGIPHVNCTIRSANIHTGRSFFKRITFLLSDAIVANSAAGMTAWKQKGLVIYNGFDSTRIEGICPSKKNRTIQIIMTGRVAVQKDFTTFLNAARILDERVEKDEFDLVFKVVGDGPLFEQVKNYFSDLVAKGKIIFTGRLDEPLQDVFASDIGVLMTNSKAHAEGCSNSIMEYMVASLPVVCSRNGGNSELVLENITGFIIESGSANSLAERIYKLCKDKDLREKLGKSGKERIEQHFSIGEMVYSYHSLFRKLSGGNE